MKMKNLNCDTNIAIKSLSLNANDTGTIYFARKIKLSINFNFWISLKEKKRFDKIYFSTKKKLEADEFCCVFYFKTEKEKRKNC